MGRAAIIGCLAVLASACAPAGLAEQRARLQAQQDERMAALDQVEARLEAIRGREGMWEYLRERHANVSAIACENASQHVAGMEMYQAYQRDKQAGLDKHRRVAQRSILPGDIVPISN